MQVPFRYLSIASSFEPCQGKGPCTSDRLWNPISSGATWVNFHDHDVGPWKQMDSAPSVINRSTCTFAHLAPRAHAQAIRDSRLTYKEKRFRKPGGGCIDFIQYLKVNLELYKRPFDKEIHIKRAPRHVQFHRCTMLSSTNSLAHSAVVV